MLHGRYRHADHNHSNPSNAGVSYDRAVNNWQDEQTDDPLYADDRNFYKVEAWGRDGIRIDALLYAGNNLSKAQEIFFTTVRHRPDIRLTNPAADAGVAAVAPIMTAANAPTWPGA